MGKRISISDLKPVLAEHSSFVLCSHARPDGDAIGSVIAMKAMLEGIGKTVVVLNEDGVPDHLKFLSGWEDVVVPSGEKVDAEVFIAFDTANQERLGQRCLQAVADVPLVVNIDHHISNEEYGDLFYVDDTAAAVGEIVYDIATQLNLPIPDAARDAMYVAVSTDTGSFQYANTGVRTHRMVADLVERGVKVGEINSAIYHDYPFRRVELLTSLLGTLERSADGRVAWWMLRQDVKDRLEVQPGDSEGLVDVMRAIRGVVACVFFEELKGGDVRISMRSKSKKVNVCEVCAKFGGGGHVMASGARCGGDPDEVMGEVLAALAAAVMEAGFEPIS
ncbi:MAG: bifunctional oligoribonuclease/PAP phosphatase NrnA [Akkermansiaceae bacterium]|nr:bifunctional oligoribonuclease/PAP phosphatase NrnA [Akkermansiaceae bacterium]